MKKNKQSKNIEKLKELVDGCYTIVELWNAESPAQKIWKKEWLEKAKKLVPGCDSLYF